MQVSRLLFIIVTAFVLLKDFGLSFLICLPISSSVASLTWTWTGDKMDTQKYLITWFSPKEFSSKVKVDDYFRTIVNDMYEDELYRYYGLSYYQAIVDAASMFKLTKFGSIVIDGVVGVNEFTHYITGLVPEVIYDVRIRSFYEESSDVVDTVVMTQKLLKGSLNCQIKTVEQIDFSTGQQTSTTTSTTTTGPVPPNIEGFETWMLFGIIPGIFFTFSTIAMFVIMLNPRWRRHIFRNKIPSRKKKLKHSRAISSRESTVSSGSSSFFRPKRNKVGIEYTSLNHSDEQVIGKHKHWVVNVPECWTPNKEEDESSTVSELTDRLHHRHSLTTVTEESEPESERENSREHLNVLRKENIVRCKTWTPNSRITAWQKTIRENSAPRTPRYTISRGWSRSSRNSDRPETRASSSLWWSDDESEFWPGESDVDELTEQTKTLLKHISKRKTQYQRRQRRVVPLNFEPRPHFSPLLKPITDEHIYEGTGDKPNKKKKKRLGTPGVGSNTKYNYQSPNMTIVAKNNEKSKLRSTKSYRNITFV